MTGIHHQQQPHHPHHSHTNHSSVVGTNSPTVAPANSHKMSGGVRRTVSSATASSGSMQQRSIAVNGVSKSMCNNSSNTQSSQNRIAANGHSNSSKDPHKKLDRSFSEPAEKKNPTNSVTTAASLAPSSRYKTELCRSFAEVGSCKYGDKCQFAHGDEELRTITRHPKFKTENCKSFHSTGFCPYGPRCHFIHNNDESKKTIINNLQAPIGTATAPVTSATPAAPIHQRIFEHSMSAPSPVTNSLHGSHVNSGPGNNGMIGQSNHFAANNSSSTLNHVNLVRPKALSLGSYSLGSSGEISSPSSQSGSPTSLNSFFTEDAGFGRGAFNQSNNRMASAFQTNTGFSFSPDSAFVSFNNTTNHPNSANMPFNSTSGNNTNSSTQSKSFFGGSQPALSSSFSPEPTNADETPISVISSLFNTTASSNTSFVEPIDVLFRAVSPLGKSQMLIYPTSPESPVDSVASEIEALKLGEQPSSFSPISSSFSNSSMSTSSVSPPNTIGDLSVFSLFPTTGTVTNNCVNNIPRLPTFTKFATNSNAGNQVGGNSIGTGSPSSSNGSIELFE